MSRKLFSRKSTKLSLVSGKRSRGASSSSRLCPSDVDELHELIKSKASIAKIRKAFRTTESVDAFGSEGTAALHVMCSQTEYLDMDALELLAGLTQNISLPDKHGWTPLHYVCSNTSKTNYALINYLVHMHADASAKNQEGTTPLHYFVRNVPSEGQEREYVEVLEMVSQSVYINAQNVNGETPLHSAVSRGNVIAFEVLVEHGAKLEMSNKYGETALHYAVIANDETLVLRLLKLGVDPAVASINGTCFDVAKSIGNPIILTHIASATSTMQKNQSTYSSKIRTKKDHPTHITRGGIGGVRTLKKLQETHIKEDEVDKMRGKAKAIVSSDSAPLPSTSITRPPVNPLESLNTSTPTVKLAKLHIEDGVFDLHTSSNFTGGQLKAIMEKTRQNFLVDYKEIELKSVIGQGGFGVVHKATWRGTTVAVKAVFSTLTEETDLYHEVNTLSFLRHPNIVQFLGACLEEPHVCIITEYMNMGDLRNVLDTCGPSLAWYLRVQMGLRAARGMLYLHMYNPPIVHRDLKSPNLLVDRSFNVKVADFGLSKAIKQDQGATGGKGTLNWMAPEVLNNLPYSPAGDVYSFGVILWELLTCEWPWGKKKGMQVVLAIANGDQLAIPESTDEQFKSIVKGCMDGNPKRRPGMLEVVDLLTKYKRSLKALQTSSTLSDEKKETSPNES